jgi:hypothetical protein
MPRHAGSVRTCRTSSPIRSSSTTGITSPPPHDGASSSAEPNGLRQGSADRPPPLPLPPLPPLPPPLPEATALVPQPANVTRLPPRSLASSGSSTCA